MSSVSEGGDTESETHSVVIRKIRSHSVKLTVWRRENRWVHDDLMYHQITYPQNHSLFRISSNQSESPEDNEPKDLV